MKLLIVFIVWNLITFFMMGIDKKKAIADKRRISEKTLLMSSFLMGAAGITAGGLFFHHKTRKIKFLILVPLSIVFNGFIIYQLININIL